MAQQVGKEHWVTLFHCTLLDYESWEDSKMPPLERTTIQANAMYKACGLELDIVVSNNQVPFRYHPLPGGRKDQAR